ncbi:hypothetical protein KI123_002973 [Enterococcus faecalis]|nr:hypothetical protein [Enterococcus faecalis]
MKTKELKERIEREYQLMIRQECEELEVRKECLLACVNHRFKNLYFDFLLLKKQCKCRLCFYYLGVSLFFLVFTLWGFFSEPSSFWWFFLVILAICIFCVLEENVEVLFSGFEPIQGFSLKGIYDEVQRIDKEIEKNKAKLNK